MRIKKRLIVNDDYYEYSASYIKKYILIAFIIIAVISSIYLFIYINYNTVPNKSFAKNNIPTIENNSIMNKKGAYYTGTFTNIPKSIDINDNMRETVYMCLFHDNNIILWKLYKYDMRRYFSYNAFNILDGDSQGFIIKEDKKNFLDFYDNFIRSQFKKTEGAFNLEIPNFENTKINLETSINNLIDSELTFKFTNFHASMINWKGNRALYNAFYFGIPKGYLTVPGSDNTIDERSSILIFNTVGRIPSRYTHNIIMALVYSSYSTKPIPILIYDSKPESQNSKIIKILYKNKWYVYNNFISHQYKDTIDFYSKELGFSLVFNLTGKENKDSFGNVIKMDNTISLGVLNGYLTINDEQLNINGNAVKESMHSVF